MRNMQAVLKGGSALAVLCVTYIDKTFSPLFWALLVLAAIDILLNMHHEEKQFQKFGSAFAAIGGTSVLSNHVQNLQSPDILRIAVAVAVLAYLQIVLPQVIALVGKLKLPTSEKDAVIAALQAENAKLQTQATSAADHP